MVLDAFALLPDVGPAITLANIALEVRIAQVLGELVPATGAAPALWSWITDRQQYWQNPSVKDQFDVLLRALSLTSLRDDAELWKAFEQLRQARNSFVHTGQARVGPKRGLVVTPAKAAELLESALRIMDWMDQLPVQSRGPQFRFPTQFSYHLPVAKVRAPGQDV